ncbi:hypothetical protein BS47DRAFT_1370540 [Hydnum rufescens UP504]|uniref:Ubiquitin-like domain-containing protein n=1 Tax=Hydnum rufescens UP504 TaxID=1448309 RepID=A0A9P6E2B8_9AGAM|nr:hypothetical protein BS47DRAFT_1370540 [Hydnum rufescens UP504]
MDLKDKLYSLTSVPPERQKILGLVKGKLPPDECTIRDLKLAGGRKFTLVGTPIGKELKERTEDMPDVMNDFDIDVSEYPELMRAFANDQRNIRKIREATESLDIHLINPPRPASPFSQSLVDTKPLLDGCLPTAECARPGLHTFLEAVYPYYDICIWSQTSWVWLETKLVELRMLGCDQPYKICFVLDKRPMFKVFTKRDGKSFAHHVKPLKIIWNKFPQWNANNTIHIDDLSRNFALNYSCGLKISAFKDAHTLQGVADRELFKLSQYLVHIASFFPDFNGIDHKDWKSVVRSLKPSSD